MDLFERKVSVYGPKLMQDFGLTAEQAAGVFGNIGHECAGFAIMQEIKPVVAGSRGGYGWCQWTGPRRVAFESYCKRNNLNPSSDQANYAYLFVELSGPERAAIEGVKKARNLTTTTEIFCRLFERPGVVGLPSRMRWSTRALAAIQAAAMIPPPPDIPAPAPATADKPASGGFFSALIAKVRSNMSKGA